MYLLYYSVYVYVPICENYATDAKIWMMLAILHILYYSLFNVFTVDNQYTQF